VIAGFAWMLVANAAACLSAHAVLRRLGIDKGPHDLALLLLIRLALISAAVLVAGLTGTLTAAGLGLLGAVVILGLAASGHWRHLAIPALPSLSRIDVVLALLMLGKVLVQVWVFAPHVTDVLSYHLPKVAEWVRAGRITSELGLDNHATFPAGFELIETWWVVFLHHDALIEMAGVEFLLLAFSSVYGLAKHLGLQDRSAFLAALLFASTPGLILQSTACLNDAPVAALGVTTVLLIVSRLPWPMILLAAGLGVGVKATFAYIAPGLALLHWLVRAEPRRSPVSKRTAVALGILGVLLGSIWYARNLWWFGNPVYPIGARGLLDEEGHQWIQAGPSLAGFLKNGGDFLNNRLYDARPYGSLCEGILGWGGVAFCAGILALPAAVRSDRRIRNVACSLGLSLLCVIALVKHDPWCSRFVLFFPSVLAIAAAFMVERHPSLMVAVGTAFVLQLAGTLVPGELSPGAVRSLWSQPWRDRTVEVIAPDEAESIAYFGGNEGEPYLLYRPGYSRKVVYLRVEAQEDLVAAMGRHRVQYLYAVPSGRRQRNLFASALSQGRLRKLKERLYVVDAPSNR
jgi:hypothetical protein